MSQDPCWTPCSTPTGQRGQWMTQSTWDCITSCNTLTAQGHLQGSCLRTSARRSTPYFQKSCPPKSPSSLYPRHRSVDHQLPDRQERAGEGGGSHFWYWDSFFPHAIILLTSIVRYAIATLASTDSYNTLLPIDKYCIVQKPCVCKHTWPIDLILISS